MTARSVSQYIEGLEDGTVFAIRDVCSNTDSGYDTVKTLLSRACTSGRIDRVHHGVYHKPRYNSRLGCNIPCNIEDVASAIARNNGWRLGPEGDCCLNLLGLSTQMPAGFVYYSDGPSRTYNVDGAELVFRHRPPSKLPRDRDMAVIVSAVDSWGRSNCDDGFIRALSKVIPERGVEYFDGELDGVTGWI